MKTSITLLRNALKSKLSSRIKYFYIGDPVLIPESLMPCITISPNRTETDFADSGRDKHSHVIDIALIINAKTYFNAAPEKMVGSEFLMEIMSLENTDGSLSDNSILGVLRDNLSLGSNRWINNISSIDYSVRRRTEDLITLEAVVTVQVDRINVR
jgi:hypothetical protein